jgi:hypothetical protein
MQKSPWTFVPTGTRKFNLDGGVDTAPHFAGAILARRASLRRRANVLMLGKIVICVSHVVNRYMKG